MKFEVSFQDPKIQVSFAKLSKGGKINIYFFSGDRYEHITEVIGYGGDLGFLFVVINKETDKVIGDINVVPESEEEKEFFKSLHPYYNRNKETDTYLLLPNESHINGTFVYHRNFLDE